MKNTTIRQMMMLMSMAAVVLTALFLTACAGPVAETQPVESDPTEETPIEVPPTEAPTEEPTAEPSKEEEASPTPTTLFVASYTAECTGVAPMKCMLVKESPDDDWLYFYDHIQGFEYEEGYEYELLVLREEVENPPADASSIKWILVEVVTMTEVEEIGDALDQTDWVLESINGEAIIKGSEITAAFMDGRIGGSAGCNTYGSEYEVNGTQVSFPIFFFHQHLDAGKIHGHHDTGRRMDAPQFFPGDFVNNPVILTGRFTGHASKQSDSLHDYPPSFKHTLISRFCKRRNQCAGGRGQSKKIFSSCPSCTFVAKNKKKKNLVYLRG